MRTILLGAALGLALFCSASAQVAPAPERTVSGHTLTSARLPKVKIQVPTDFSYDGALRWVLNGHSDAEVHVFADSGPQHQVRRLFWIQFEGYMPAFPDLNYGYDSPRHIQIGGMDFFVDTFAHSRAIPVRPGSDREKMQALLLAPHDGMPANMMPANMMYVRFVHLLDATKRRELMIIYGEVLPDSAGIPADDKEHDLPPELANGLIARGAKALTITN